jgi:hypothetical protein
VGSRSPTHRLRQGLDEQALLRDGAGLGGLGKLEGVDPGAGGSEADHRTAERIGQAVYSSCQSRECTATPASSVLGWVYDGGGATAWPRIRAATLAAASSSSWGVTC